MTMHIVTSQNTDIGFDKMHKQIYHLVSQNLIQQIL